MWLLLPLGEYNIFCARSLCFTHDIIELRLNPRQANRLSLSFQTQQIAQREGVYSDFCFLKSWRREKLGFDTLCCYPHRTASDVSLSIISLHHRCVVAMLRIMVQIPPSADLEDLSDKRLICLIQTDLAREDGLGLLRRDMPAKLKLVSDRPKVYNESRFDVIALAYNTRIWQSDCYTEVTSFMQKYSSWIVRPHSASRYALQLDLVYCTIKWNIPPAFKIPWQE